MIGSTLFGNGWIEILLGREFRFETSALALLVLAAGSNVVFVLLRSVLDATSSRPRNAIHAFISLCTFLLMWSLSGWIAPGHPLLGVCSATAGSFIVLAGVALLALAREMQIWPGARVTLRWLGVQIVVLAMGFALRCEPSSGLVRFLGAQLVLGFVWLLAMKVLRVRWPLELWRFVRPKQAAEARANPSTGQTTIGAVTSEPMVVEGSMLEIGRS